MVRKLFATTFVISMLGVLLVGGVLAWTSTLSTNRTGTLGTVKAELADVHDTGLKLYPGNSTVLATGKIVNKTPTDPGAALRVTSARVEIPGVTVGSDRFPQACTSPVFTLKGTVTGDVAMDRATPIPPGGGERNWQAVFKLSTDSSNDCQGRTFNYNVVFDLST